MIEDSFLDGNSIIHNMDPRLRIIIAFIFSFLISISQQLPTLLLGLTVAILISFPVYWSNHRIQKKIIFVNKFILLFWIFLPLTMDGQPIVLLGGLIVSKEGIWLAAILTLKMNVLLLVLTSLVVTIPISLLGKALQSLKLPDKLVVLLLFTYRYIFILEQEFRTLQVAAKLRGFEPATNLHTYRTYAHMTGMLLVRSITKAKQLQQAMVCRGFTGRFHSLSDMALKSVDWMWLGFFICCIAGLGGVEWIPR
ncbi:MAG: cobalt ECF transporter T component CbiQ [SAR324 cluster bacterium]|nr:cobalt ECF transporter T component CbiQ [SAR324 cluster bacterium]